MVNRLPSTYIRLPGTVIILCAEKSGRQTTTQKQKHIYSTFTPDITALLLHFYSTFTPLLLQNFTSDPMKIEDIEYSNDYGLPGYFVNRQIVLE